MVANCCANCHPKVKRCLGGLICRHGRPVQLKRKRHNDYDPLGCDAPEADFECLDLCAVNRRNLGTVEDTHRDDTRRYMVFAADGMEFEPQQQDILVDGDETYMVQTVREFYPGRDRFAWDLRVKGSRNLA